MTKKGEIKESPGEPKASFEKIVSENGIIGFSEKIVITEIEVSTGGPDPICDVLEDNPDDFPELPDDIVPDLVIGNFQLINESYKESGEQVSANFEDYGFQAKDPDRFENESIKIDEISSENPIGISNNDTSNIPSISQEKPTDTEINFNEQTCERIEQNNVEPIVQSETEYEALQPNQEVATLTRPSDITSEIYPKTDAVETLKDSMNELNQLDSIHNEAYKDLCNNSHWAQELDQGFKDLQEKIETQREMTQFWSHFGYLTEAEMQENQTKLDVINDQIYDSILEMQDIALNNPATYEKNVRDVAERINIDENGLVSKFEEVSNDLEKADPNNPFEMERLLDRIEDYKFEKLELELNKAYAKEPNKEYEVKEKTTERNEGSISKESKGTSIEHKEYVSETPRTSIKNFEGVKEGTSEKIDSKLVFKAEKPVRVTGYEINTNSDLKIKGKLHVSMDIKKWKELPESKGDDSVIVIADYELIDNTGNKQRIGEVKSEVFNNGYKIYIRPIDENNSEAVKKMMKEEGEFVCIIPGLVDNKEQLPNTDYFYERAKTALDTQFSNLSEMKLAAKGWALDTYSEIYLSNEEKVFVKQECKKDKSGGIWLAGELGRFIENWFENDDCIYCSIDGEEPIVLKPKIREINDKAKRKVKEISIPYWGDREEVVIVFSNPTMKLNEKAIQNLKYKETLTQAGHKILSFKVNQMYEGAHKDQEIETIIKGIIITEAFEHNPSVDILSEVEIIPEYSNGHSIWGNRYVFDNVLIQKDECGDATLSLIEIKTSEGASRIKQIDDAIANLHHYKKRIGNESTTPIIFMNDDFKSGNRIITKEFGDEIGVILIGLSELENLKTNPELLNNRINEFKHQQLSLMKNQKTKATVKWFSSTYKDNKILQKYKDLLAEKIPPEIQIKGQRASTGKGAKFEEKIKDELEKEGYDVVSNVMFSYFERIMEIDLLAFKDQEMKVVSCKDKSSSTNPWSVNTDVKNAANRIEFRLDLLNADKAEFYVNINSEIIDYIEEKYQNKKWTDNVNIFVFENLDN